MDESKSALASRIDAIREQIILVGYLRYQEVIQLSECGVPIIATLMGKLKNEAVVLFDMIRRGEISSQLADNIVSEFRIKNFQQNG
jgi:predicted methyltransferase